MSKQGQHEGDRFDQTKSKGNNHHDRTQEITTGTYKRPETYRQQAFEHSGNTGDQGGKPQAAKNGWREDRLDHPRNEGASHGNVKGGSPRARDSDLGSSGRSGSDSNAS